MLAQFKKLPLRMLTTLASNVTSVIKPQLFVGDGEEHVSRGREVNPWATSAV